MRLPITEGAGFIACARRSRAVNLDKLPYDANLDSPTDVLPSPRCAFEQVDICDAAKARRAFETRDPDAVMHFAAESHVERAIERGRQGTTAQAPAALASRGRQWIVT